MSMTITFQELNVIVCIVSKVKFPPQRYSLTIELIAITAAPPPFRYHLTSCGIKWSLAHAGCKRDDLHRPSVKRRQTGCNLVLLTRKSCYYRFQCLPEWLISIFSYFSFTSSEINQTAIKRIAAAAATTTGKRYASCLAILLSIPEDQCTTFNWRTECLQLSGHLNNYGCAASNCPDFHLIIIF